MSTYYYQLFTKRRIYDEIIYQTYEEIKGKFGVSSIHGDCYDNAFEHLRSLGLNELETEKLYLYINSLIRGNRDGVQSNQTNNSIVISLMSTFLAISCSLIVILLSKEMISQIFEAYFGIILYLILAIYLTVLITNKSIQKKNEINEAMLHIIKRYKKENFSNSTL